MIAAKAEAKALLIQAEAQAKARELLVVEGDTVAGEIEFAERVKQRIEYQERKRQANIASVVGKAAAELEDKTVPASEPDHDWAARFFGDVQDVSSDEMQVLWGKILAGEVENPGSTSTRTLGILKDLDRATAELFVRFCSACIFRPNLKIYMLDARVPSLGGRAASNSLEMFGLGFGALNCLNEHGLIISDYHSSFDYAPCQIERDAGRRQVVQPFQFEDKLWILAPMPNQSRKAEFWISGVALSIAGRELSMIVDRQPVPHFAEKLKQFFVDNGLLMTQARRPNDLRDA